MSRIEILSNDYNNRVNKKIYEIISLTSFYYEEIDWSLSNFKYFYKNIKLIIMMYLIIFFDFILFLFLFLILFNLFSYH